jgi:hypothetical protein
MVLRLIHTIRGEAKAEERAHGSFTRRKLMQLPLGSLTRLEMEMEMEMEIA